MKDIDPKPLAEAKLASSGLDMKDAAKLRIEVLTASATQALGFEKVPALKFNYLGPDGKPLTGWPKHPPFYRVRFLATKNDFSKQQDPEAKEEKRKRYSQTPGSSACAYFPQTVDWAGVLADKDNNIVITEGELKAACACKNGFPTIGLGGVRNFSAVNKGVTFLPELEAIDWVKRNVYICFDSDYRGNADICSAIHVFAEVMQERGAFVYLISLPELKHEEGKEKTGLDDFLVDQGPQPFADLKERAMPLGLTAPLFGFNEKYIYIRDPGLIISQITQAKIGPEMFKGHLEASKKYHERFVTSKGDVITKPVSAAGAWVSWPLRRQANNLSYSPGRPRLLEPEGGYNTWQGWGVQPAKGDVRPFMDLLGHLFDKTEPEALEWFLNWLAYPLQNPGVKMFQSAVIYGLKHGTGKSLVGYTMGRIYGKNFTEIDRGDLDGSFNEWAEGKQFVMGDDVAGSDKREHADMLKKLITQKEMRVNVKYIPSYVVQDCINYLFTSNHPDAFFLEDDDRRFFIHEVQVSPMLRIFYQKYTGDPGKANGWLDQGGAAAVFDFLLKRDLSKFDAAGPAFKTQARARMVTDGQSDLGAWVRKLREQPDAILWLNDLKLNRDLYSNYELLSFYDPTTKTRTSANGLGRELRRAGFKQVNYGSLLNVPGAVDRYYCVRNFHKWEAATPKELIAHITTVDAARKAKF